MKSVANTIEVPTLYNNSIDLDKHKDDKKSKSSDKAMKKSNKKEDEH